MKLLAALLILLAIGLSLPIVLPIMAVGLTLTAVLGCLFIWFLPILIIAASDRTTGGEKAAWILAIIFLSWFAWIFYFLLAPLKDKPYQRRYREDRYDRYDDDRSYRSYRYD